jgi:hypothetical protein
LSFLLRCTTLYGNLQYEQANVTIAGTFYRESHLHIHVPLLIDISHEHSHLSSFWVRMLPELFRLGRFDRWCHLEVFSLVSLHEDYTNGSKYSMTMVYCESTGSIRHNAMRSMRNQWGKLRQEAENRAEVYYSMLLMAHFDSVCLSIFFVRCCLASPSFAIPFDGIFSTPQTPRYS